MTESGQLAPTDVPGELWLQGTQVALKYIGNPKETNQKFVTKAVVGDRPQRWYRTGDLCRKGTDGVLHYLGRIDHQIKIRGYRVEIE